MHLGFPYSRLRRNRLQPWLRDSLRETILTPSDFFLPLFVCEDQEEREIEALPGVVRHSISELTVVVKHAKDLGINAVLLFPVLGESYRSPQATEACNPDGLIPRAIKAIKQTTSGVGVIVDIALDPYTQDGHDGITINGIVDNDITVEILCNQALVYADAGADIVAPSDMMDGRVAAIRSKLDNAGHIRVGIMSYAAKFCSSLYAPFRKAVGIKRTNIDKRSYQLDPANGREALREIEQDIGEGADMIIIKPALFYLDIIKASTSQYNIPVSAYLVSGEYAMLRNTGNPMLMIEACIGLKRAGASIIITYGAIELIKSLKDCY